MIRKNDDSEQRALIAILLSLVVFYLWTSVFAPPPPPPAAELPAQPETPQVAGVEGAVPAAPVAPAAPAQVVPDRELPVRTDQVQASLSSKGGGLRDVILPEHVAAYDVTPLWRRALDTVTGKAEGEWKPYGDTPGAEQLVTDKGVILSAGVGPRVDGDYIVEGDGENWMARRTTAEGIQIVKNWSVTDDPEMLTVTVSFKNNGNAPYSGELWLGTVDVFEGEAGRYTDAVRPQGVADGDLETLTDLEKADKKGPQSFDGGTSWFGVGDRYFLAAAVPQDPSWGDLVFAHSEQPTTNNEAIYGAYLVRDTTLAVGQVDSQTFQLFIGAKEKGKLADYGSDLDLAVDLGFFGLFANVLLWVLQGVHALVGSWGLSIILLTVLVKALFFPLTQKSFVSGRKMQALNPQMKELKEKYKDNPQELGQAQMKMFKEEGVNPLAGCLPMVVQMPVWFALFSVLLYTSDLYHAEFLYLKDLSSVDPIGVLPVLYGALMIIQMQLTPTSPNMDATQQKVMKMMPLMFSFFAFIFPSGLALYMLVNALLSITQMWFINRKYPVPTSA